MILESNLVKRVSSEGIIGSTRWSLYDNLGLLLTKNWGGRLTNTASFIGLSYAHNIWLDCYIEAGVIPFIALIIIAIVMIKYIFYAVRNFYISDYLSVIYMIVGLLLLWSVEPVLQADPYWFCSCVGVFSAIQEYLWMNRKGQME